MDMYTIIRRAFVAQFPISSLGFSFDDENEVWTVLVDGDTYTCQIGSDDDRLEFVGSTGRSIIVEIPL